MQKALGLNYSIKALLGSMGGQWERERRDTMFLMFAVALCILTHVAHQPIWITVAFAVLFVWRLGLILSGRWLPRSSVRAVAGIASALAVYAEYHTLFGRDAGVGLLILFLGLKLMEIRAKRDLFVVIFLCFFLLLTSFFYSQTAVAAALVTAACLSLVASMMTMHYGLVEVPIRARFKAASVILLQALPIAAILFVLFPRLQNPLWALPSDAQTSARTGLSESMSVGGISDLSQSEAIAFRVKFDDTAGIATPTPAQNQLYWRGPVLGKFDGKTWRPNLFEVTAPPVPEVKFDAKVAPLNYTVTLEPTARNWVFALEHPIELPVIDGRQTRATAELQLISNDTILERTRYQARTQIGSKIGLNETRLSIQNWLDLPPSYNPKTLELAATWRAQQTEAERENPEHLVKRALELFSRAPFRYTLKAPLLGRNSVDDFLFKTKAGFCEHYAQAFVVLMRAVDIPARVVTGYQGGERNPIDGYLTVRQSDAHGWAEIWIEGKGWVRVDPTAAVAPERIERTARLNSILDQTEQSDKELGLLSKAKFRLEALTNSWNQWVLSYDYDKQKRLMGMFGISIDDWRQLGGLLAGLLALAVAGVALLTLRPQRHKDPLQRIWLGFCAKLAKVGVARRPEDTANTVLARAQRVVKEPQPWKQMTLIVSTYNRLRYENQSVQKDELRHFKKLVQDFKP
jgi:protein-glutamine gamma-glutamyltransferase